MESTIIQKSKDKPFFSLITPIMVSVFSVYLTMGMTLGTLPTFLRNDLRPGSFIIGMAIGLQSLATLLTRAYAGKITDTKGANRSNHIGAFLVMLTGGVYLISLLFINDIAVALGLIFLARVLHGISESLLVTGALTWGIGLAGVDKTGKVMTWNGIAMYAGIAAGAPLGIALSGCYGMRSVFCLIILLAMVSYIATKKLLTLAINSSHIRIPFYKVIGKISNLGLGLAFASIGFACISSFIALLFTTQSWGNSSAAFMAFGGFYILVRIFFAHLPDVYGGYKVTYFSLIIEIIGLFVIALSTSKLMAIVGCALTGAGFSLIFPSLGVLVVKKVDAQMRGTALGAYSAFFDLSLGLAAPIAGLIAGWFDYNSVYVFGGVCSLLAGVVLLLQKRK